MEVHKKTVTEDRQEHQITVSIIILTWNSEHQIGPCLASLERGLQAFSSEIIVVDNGSKDRTCAIISNSRPDAQLLRNPDNRGVAPARNQGIRHSQGKYVLILDDDTVVQANALDRLIHYMEANPEVGLCGPKLTDTNGELQLSCRRFPTLLDKLARRLPGALAHKVAAEAEMADWDHKTIRQVDYVIGACQLIRRSALDAVGLLDERIFYGPEDVDICLRLQQAGWSVVYNPEAIVVHEERRMTRSLITALAWRHIWGLGYFFHKHEYLFSRDGLYVQIAQSNLHEQSTGSG